MFYNLLFSILFFYVYICTMVLDMYYLYSVMISNSLTTCKNQLSSLHLRLTLSTNKYVRLCTVIKIIKD